ncbi:YetF domain-containing protein [Pseudonocardia kunmingensis]|uniref:YetF domain-containing protein n=1 Tax=Pseudonocardia kunmingensis TaxID=630975 RepID=UPI0014782AB2
MEHPRWVTSALRREGLRVGDIATALRAQNADGVADVERAVLEPGGSLVVTLRRDEQPADHGDVAGLHR